MSDGDAGHGRRGDGAEAMAAALLSLLEDPDRARAMGANARAMAERDYDWRVIGERLASEILARIG